jgi:DNA-binding NarL/FixJ family response regulator
MQPPECLTNKGVQVSILVWAGLTNRDIARRLETRRSVVKNYLRNTFDKLGVWSCLKLARQVARHAAASWKDPLVVAETCLCFRRHLHRDKSMPAH